VEEIVIKEGAIFGDKADKEEGQLGQNRKDPFKRDVLLV